MKNKLVLGICLVIIFSQVGFSSEMTEKGIYSVNELVEIALQKSPVIEIAKTDIESAKGLLMQADSALKPSLSFGLNYKNWDQNRKGYSGAPANTTQFFSDQLYDTSLTFRQMILDFGKTKSRAKASRIKVKSLENQLFRTQQELVYEVMSLCVSSISQKADIGAIDKNLQDIDAALKRVIQLKNVGKVAKIDVMRLQYRKQEVLAQSDEAKNKYHILMANIAKISGLKSSLKGVTSETHPEPGNLEQLASDDLVKLAYKNRFDLLALNNNQTSSNYLLRAAKHGLSPTLNLVATTNKYGNETGWGINNGYVGVEIKWPLLDGKLAKGKIKTAIAEKNKIESKINEMKLHITSQVNIALSTLKTNLSRIKRSKKGLELAKETYRIELLTYDNGKATINDLLDAQAELFAARAKLILDKNDLFLSRITLNLATGKIPLR